MDKDTFFKKLPVPVSDEQLKVILADDKATVVNASAGSGKTTTIIIKMLYQINVLGVEPNSILAITFSKNAQQDMLHRYDELALNFEPRIAKPRFKTFHAFFLNLLGIANEHVYFCDPHKFYSKLQFCLKKVPGSDKWDMLDDILQTYGKLVNNDLTYDGITGKDGQELDLKRILEAKLFSSDDYKAVITRYQALKLSHHSIDFDDMQLRLLDILESSVSSADEIRCVTHEAFSQCYIDEFQDINALQVHILNELFDYDGESLWNHTCVIGDPNQAIYAFRGSDSHFILDFDKVHDDVQKFYLTTNYRCPSGILNPVLPLVNQKGKVLAHNEGGNVSVLKTYDSIIAKIKQLDSNDSNAIIVRKHSSAIILVDKLARAGVKVKTKDRHELLLENNYFKDLMDVIRLADTHDTKLLAHFVYPLFMVGHATVSPNFTYQNVLKKDNAYDYFVAQNHGHVDPEIELALDEIHCAKDAETRVNTAIDLLEPYYRRSKNKSLIKQINHYLTEELVYDDDDQPLSFATFERNNVLLTRKLRDWAREEESVTTILTSHAVKGLEFDNVFYVDVNDDVLLTPNIYNDMLKNDDYADFETDFEEERHLFYVTWTRAKKHLFVNFVPHQQSRFFDELDVKYDPTIQKQHWTAFKYANELKQQAKLGHAELITKQEWNDNLRHGELIE